MKIGIPTEIKPQEYRVALPPHAVAAIVQHGHEVVVQSDAGSHSGYSDHDYIHAGATLADDAASVFAAADMICKVKEPQPDEYELLRPGQLLFTYLHLAANKPLTNALMKSRCVALAYETVTDRYGRFPLLTPMSEIAGRLAVQAGTWFLQANNGGAGVMLSGVSGVMAGKVVIVGGGVVGENAAILAMGLGADVYVLDARMDRIRELNLRYGSRLHTCLMSRPQLHALLPHADIVVGAVLMPGDKAPHVVSKADLKLMKPKSLLVDVAIDQGGCFETSRATCHEDPVYQVNGINHYCVANMPSVCAQTASVALSNATLPYVLELADAGWQQAVKNNQFLAEGLNVCNGDLTIETVGRLFDLPYKNLADFR
ncbi:Alanine dehydrogenase [BD1-7 clade bacterium]|uniref:Alanine dehydrogenase n=1 Tax=BD1-7 clade bacterium TaxID=2029982 RepID=A0A5S9PJ82_9GAMM|nr:Alanine dehydrogenase [BD1-7 clade bacterium]CAA0104015.1 Alanine dehydrogenase [BD1-7 clade bacterium]